MSKAAVKFPKIGHQVIVATQRPGTPRLTYKGKLISIGRHRFNDKVYSDKEYVVIVVAGSDKLQHIPLANVVEARKPIYVPREEEEAE